MQWHAGRALFWTAIGLVVCSFLLAVAGEETASTTTRQTLLLWHESIWLGSLVVLLLAFTAHALDSRRSSRLLPNWLPRLRALMDVLLYVLLVIQPISGWLLASHEGKLASLSGWTLPSLAGPSNLLADIGYIYHGAGGALIVLIAIFSLRLNVKAWLFSLLDHSARRRRATHQGPKPKALHHSDG
jgi:cytochrome b561